MNKSLICLPHLAVCNQSIRFINYSSNERTFTVSVKPENTSAALFLGADILSFSNQLSSHYGRIHTRYAKLGLATKVHFEDVLIDGIANSSALWFYSIQGLFRVAFEYLDKEIQQFCLLQLKDLWLASVNQHLLCESVDLIYAREETRPDASFHKLCSSGCSQQISCISFENMESSVTCSSVQFGADLSQPLCEDSDQVMMNDADRLYQSIQVKLQQIADTTTADKLRDNLCCLLKFFVVDCFPSNSPSSPVFPYTVLNEYTSIIDEMSADGPHHISGNRNDAAGRHSLLLCLICKWIGDRFADLRQTIEERAEMFKRQNISRIDCLPNPSHVVEYIFPQCMIQLLLHWMSNAVSLQSASINDCCGHKLKATAAMPAINQEQLYAFIQLILEYANGCLVSGIAHVLYPRLLQVQM